MLTLFSYPELFGVADNNPYGLKVFAFLKLCHFPFRHEHVFDGQNAPRAQLPYIVDDGEPIGDSDTITRAGSSSRRGPGARMPGSTGSRQTSSSMTSRRR
jgi:glutathione S-transferase-like protein